MTVTIDWENLGFSYMKLPYRYIAHFKMDNGIKESSQRDATCIAESLQVFTMDNKHSKV